MRSKRTKAYFDIRQGRVENAAPVDEPVSTVDDAFFV